MVYDSIASHLINTFGEYPYLTLNAYNPWALVAEGANAMDRSLAWIHDAPWTDAASGASGTGYLIGPFPPSVLVLALVMVVLLVVAALAGRRLSRGLEDAPDPAAVDTGADLDASRGASHRFRMEFGGLSYAFLIAAAGITAVVLIGMTGLLYAAVLGDGLLLTILIGVSIWAAWRDAAQSLLVALTVLTIAFFVVPTRAHERYLFPFFGLGAVLLVVSWRWRVAYVVLSVINAANLLAVLVQYQGIPAADGTVAGTLNDWGNGLLSARWFDGIIWPIAVCGVTTGLAMVWALLQLRGRALAALDREVTRGGGQRSVWPIRTARQSLAPPLPWRLLGLPQAFRPPTWYPPTPSLPWRYRRSTRRPASPISKAPSMHRARRMTSTLPMRTSTGPRMTRREKIDRGTCPAWSCRCGAGWPARRRTPTDPPHSTPSHAAGSTSWTYGW